MAGAGEDCFDRQEEFVLQEAVYSREVKRPGTGNAMGGGGVVGGYRTGKVGNLNERFASALGLTVEVIEEVGFGGVGEEVGILPVKVLMHCFLASS